MQALWNFAGRNGCPLSQMYVDGLHEGNGVISIPDRCCVGGIHHDLAKAAAYDPDADSFGPVPEPISGTGHDFATWQFHSQGIIYPRSLPSCIKQPVAMQRAGDWEFILKANCQLSNP